MAGDNRSSIEQAKIPENWLSQQITIVRKNKSRMLATTMIGLRKKNYISRLRRSIIIIDSSTLRSVYEISEVIHNQVLGKVLKLLQAPRNISTPVHPLH